MIYLDIPRYRRRCNQRNGIDKCDDELLLRFNWKDSCLTLRHSFISARVCTTSIISTRFFFSAAVNFPDALAHFLECL